MWHADRLNEKRKSDTAAAATAGRIGEDDLAIPKLRPSRSSSDIARNQLYKIGLPGKSILGDYFQENMTS